MDTNKLPDDMQELLNALDSFFAQIKPLMDKMHKNFIKRDLWAILGLVSLLFSLICNTRGMRVTEITTQTIVGMYNIFTCAFFLLVTLTILMAICWLIFDIHGHYSGIKNNIYGSILSTNVCLRLFKSFTGVILAYIMGFLALFEVTRYPF